MRKEVLSKLGLYLILGISLALSVRTGSAPTGNAGSAPPLEKPTMTSPRVSEGSYYYVPYKGCIGYCFGKGEGRLRWPSQIYIDYNANNLKSESDVYVTKSDISVSSFMPSGSYVSNKFLIEKDCEEFLLRNFLAVRVVERNVRYVSKMVYIHPEYILDTEEICVVAVNTSPNLRSRQRATLELWTEVPGILHNEFIFILSVVLSFTALAVLLTICIHEIGKYCKKYPAK